MNNYDVVIVGAGSTGTPLAMFLAKEKIKVLVIDELSSPGQGQNKRAIGGIRATHSDRSKILISKKSIDIFSHWEEENGDDIEWLKGGYSYPAYTQEHEEQYKKLLKIQKDYGLSIEWYDKEDYLKIVPIINRNNLRGGTFSPYDGSASPLLANNAFYFKALEHGAEFHFREKALGIKTKNNKIIEVQTDKNRYGTAFVVNAAGAYAKEMAKKMHYDLPVMPESHEGAITEPVNKFLGPMIVDMRPGEGSKNIYFYQHKTGQIAFCLTPDPAVAGTDQRQTSQFLPQVSKRMVDLIPRLKNISVRRTWRGLYPMTPDGFPIVGRVKSIDNCYNIVGMCGQGFMLGPGLGHYTAKDILGNLNEDEREILDDLSLYRDFGKEEAFK